MTAFIASVFAIAAGSLFVLSAVSVAGHHQVQGIIGILVSVILALASLVIRLVTDKR